jgi:zinc D-Ala-D-Ala carboxypeptidase
MKFVKKIKKFTNNTRVLIITLIVVLLLSGGALAYNISRNDPELAQPIISEVSEAQPETEPEDIAEEIIEKPVATPAPTPVTKPADKPKTQWPVVLSASEASSLQVVVNKKHKLPTDYVPTLTSVAGGSMRPEAAGALAKLLSAATSNSVPMVILSSYRSYSTQVSTYNRWVQQSGQAAADTFSARPGHSEHQTGLAVDLGNGTCNLESCFGSTTAGQWLASNAHSYGFIIRYPSGKQAKTGYQYEPWHLRYVGTEVATAIKNSGQTLDQYYNKPAGDY